MATRTRAADVDLGILGVNAYEQNVARCASTIPLQPPNPLDTGDKKEFAIKYLPVKKKQCTESLILSGGSDALIDVEVAKERGDLFLTHLFGMTFAVEEDEAANPIEVCFFGPDAVALYANMPADAFEEFGRARWRTVRQTAMEERWRSREIGK